MLSAKTKTTIVLLSTFLSVIFLAQFAAAEIIQATNVSILRGTDSQGSYSYGAPKSEGSKSKIAPSMPSLKSGPPPGSHHGAPKSEGSKSKSYSIKGHGSMHAKPGHGGQGKSYSHGAKKYSHGSGGYSGHGKSVHGKSSSHHASAKKGHGHKKDPFSHILCFKDKLGLTEAQVTTIKEMQFEYKKIRIQAKADHDIAHLEMERYVHSGEVNEARIRGAARKIVASKEKKIMAMAEAKIQLLKLLTAEQRKMMTKRHSAR